MTSIEDPEKVRETLANALGRKASSMPRLSGLAGCQQMVALGYLQSPTIALMLGTQKKRSGFEYEPTGGTTGKEDSTASALGGKSSPGQPLDAWAQHHSFFWSDHLDGEAIP